MAIGSQLPGEWRTTQERERKRKIWQWVAIGCGSLFLLAIGGCVFVYFAVKKVATEFVKQIEAQPAINPQDIPKLMPNVPLYPGAVYDPKISKFFVLPKLFMPKKLGKGMLMLAFSVPNSADQVSNWYKKNMSLKGWQLVKEEAQSPNPNISQKMLMFRKGNKHSIIMVQDSPQLKILFIMYFTEPLPAPKAKSP